MYKAQRGHFAKLRRKTPTNVDHEFEFIKLCLCGATRVISVDSLSLTVGDKRSKRSPAVLALDCRHFEKMNCFMRDQFK